ncbi:dihydrolipoamide acetyltransferase family protein [Nocardia sp. NPDC006044]|uniref:dihydrolipoamide acetyltransferase family protein n=1 Tax=Nocardia sp. NPDC006044 TaxID=3364306 RepID=UPI0036AE5A4D
MEDRARQPGNVLEFQLPDLGEGLADAELVSWSVGVGDEVQLNQTIAEVETAKAVVALPSPFAGRVVELLAQPGETVLVGAPLIRVQSDEAPIGQSSAKNGSDVAGDAPGAGRTAVLVGYGPEGETVSRRRRFAASVVREADSGQRAEPADGEGRVADRSDVAGPGRSPAAGSGSPAAQSESLAARTGSPAAQAGSSAAHSESLAVQQDSADVTSTTSPDLEYAAAEHVSRDLRSPLTTTRAAATPAARRLARELGIDLWFVAGSGPDGAVTVEDVRGAVEVSQPRTLANQPHAAPAATAATDADADAIRSTSREVRTPVSGIRKRTAAAMLASAGTIPQASTFVTIDCTASMELLDHLRGTKSFAGLSLTPLALVAKSALAALAEFPEINTYWDEANQEIVTKHYVNLGFAVATDRGLLVPNIKEAQSLSLRDLTRELGGLAETARSGAAAPADLRGGTFTITNVGVFGVDSGVPLVNPGEAAILCLGAIRKRPWVFRDELAIRWVTTLGLSFDHRMIDGELASRFLATTASLLEDPLTLLSRI